MTVTPGRPPLPSGGAHPAQGDRRRGVSGGFPAADRTRTVRAVRGQPLHRSRGAAQAARRQPRRVAAARGHPRRARVPTTNSYAQDVMSINDLLAFATGAQFTIESNAMVTIDDDLAARTGLTVGHANGWRSAATGRPTAAAAPVCRTEYYINRAFAAVGRLLQRHSGPIFPLIEDLFGVSIVEVHQEISAVAGHPELAGRAARSRRAPPHWKCSARTRPPTARSPRSRSTRTRRRGTGIR